MASVMPTRKVFYAEIIRRSADSKLIKASWRSKCTTGQLQKEKRNFTLHESVKYRKA